MTTLAQMHLAINGRLTVVGTPVYMIDSGGMWWHGNVDAFGVFNWSMPLAEFHKPRQKSDEAKAILVSSLCRDDVYETAVIEAQYLDLPLYVQ